jgi:hypothetical protein
VYFQLKYTYVSDLEKQALHRVELAFGDGEQTGGPARRCKYTATRAVEQRRITHWSSVAPVACWYAWNASVASNNKVVPVST